MESSDTSFDWTVPNNKELVINLGYPGNGACNDCYNYRFYHYDANGEYDEFTDSDVYKINFTGNEMPSTSSFSVSAASNAGKVITLESTDYDNDSLTFDVVSQPSSGTLSSINQSNGEITYTSSIGFSGIDSFTFRSWDGSNFSNTSTVSISVNNPAVNNVYSTINEDADVSISLDGEDGNGDSLTYSVVTGPSNGSVQISGSTANYSPNDNFNGTDIFTYKASDGTLQSNIASVIITINSVEDVPTVENISASTDEDVALDITLKGEDGDGDSLSYEVVSSPANGSISINGDIATYTPSTNWNGIDAFTYKANDSKSDSNLGTVTIDVGETGETTIYMHTGQSNGDGTESSPFNSFSDAMNELEEDPISTYATLILLPGTYSSEGSDNVNPEVDISRNINMIVKSQSLNPEDTIISSNGTNWRINGKSLRIEGLTLRNSDTSYGITHGITADGDSLVIRNAIIENNEQNAYLIKQDDENGFVLIEDSIFSNTTAPSDDDTSVVKILFASSLISNSTFIDNEVLLFDSINQLAVVDSRFINNKEINQKLSLQNSVIDNNSMQESFTSGTITNSVLRNVEAGISTTSDPGTITNSIIIDSSFNSNMSSGDYWNDYYNVKVSAGIPPKPGSSENVIGGITLNSISDIGFVDVSTTSSVQNDYHLVHQSRAIDVGDPSFDYSNEPSPNGERINAGIYGNTSEAQITNTAPVVQDIEFTSTETRTALMRESQIELIGYDADNDLITYTISEASNGGALVLDNSTVTYTPATDFNGTETFTYYGNDGQKISNVATVTITVNPISDAPVVNDVTFTENEDTPSTNVLPVIDPDENEEFTFILESLPENGTASIGTNSDNTAGFITYTPNLNWNGTEQFTYRVKDKSNLYSNIASITFNILAVDDPVSANDINSYTAVNATKNIVLNATNVDNDELTYSIVDNPTNGSASISGNIATYAPNLNWNGTDSFTYKVNDGITDSNMATVTIIVNDNGTVPVANDISIATDEDIAIQFSLDASDVDNDSLVYSLDTGPSNGSVVINDSASGLVTYTPNENWNGQDSFTYKANDGGQDSNIAQVIITVNAVNDAPVANNLNFQINQDTELLYKIVNDSDNSDADGNDQVARYYIISQPSNGSAHFEDSFGNVNDADDASGKYISYTPNTLWTGTDTFTYTVQDGEGLYSNVATVTIDVQAQPVTITSPNGGEILRTASTYTITWNGGFSNTGIDLYKGDTKVLNINGDVGSSSSYEWTIPTSLSIGDDYKINVYDASEGTDYDESDSYFSIFEQSNFSSTNSSSIKLNENSYIDLPEIDSNLGKANSSITISAWFKTDKDPNRDVIIHASTSNEQYGRMGFTDSGANGKIYLADTDVSGSTNFATNRLWNHMVYVADAQNNALKIYVNGILENSNSINLESDYFDANRLWQIGHLSEEGSQHDFTGLLDELAVWNTALTANDIASLYNSGNPTLAYNIKLSNLRAYYDFENNSLHDKTGRIINPSTHQNIEFSDLVPPNTYDGTVTFPAGGEKLICGRAYPIRWEDGFTDNGIQLYNGSQKISEITGSNAGSVNRWTWTIDCGSVGDGYSIRIFDAGSGDEYFQSGTFEIDTDPKNKYNYVEEIGYNYRQTPSTTNTTFESGKNYYMEASGTVYYSSQNLMDAAYRLRNGNQDIDPPIPYDDNQFWTMNGQKPPRPIEDHYNDSHVYDYYFTGTDEPLTFFFNDIPNGYGDNGGLLYFKIYEIETNNAPESTDFITSTSVNESAYENLNNLTSDPDSDNLSFTIIDPPSNGTATIDSDDVLKYTPNNGFTGNDTFTYQANDGVLDSSISTITVMVGNSLTINAHTYANTWGGYYSYLPIDYDSTFEVVGGTVSEHNNPKGSIQFVKCNDSGIIEGTSTPISCDNEGKFYIRYRSNTGGWDEFRYYLYDKNGAKSNIENGYTQNGSNNPAPVTGNVTGEWPNGTDGASYKVMTYGSNVQIHFQSGLIIDRLQLRYYGVNGWIGEKDIATDINPDHPDVNPEWSAGGLYYNFDFSEDLISNGQPAGTIGYKFATIASSPAYRSDGLYIGDGRVVYEYGMLYKQNHAPIANDVSVSVPANVSSQFDLSATDQDQNNRLDYFIVDEPSNGTVSISGKTASYQPNHGWHGTDTFTYNVKDTGQFQGGPAEYSESNTATVTVTVLNSSTIYMHAGDSHGIGTLEDPMSIFDTMQLSLFKDPNTGYATVILLPGTYTSNYDGPSGSIGRSEIVQISTNPFGLHLKSHSGDPTDTIIERGNYNWSFSAADGGQGDGSGNLKIEDITFRGNREAHVVMSALGDSLIVDNCIFTDIENDGPSVNTDGPFFYNGGGISEAKVDAHILIENTIFENSTFKNTITNHGDLTYGGIANALNTITINNSSFINVQPASGNTNRFFGVSEESSHPGNITINHSRFIWSDPNHRGVAYALVANNSVFSNGDGNGIADKGKFINCILTDATLGSSTSEGGTVRNSILNDMKFSALEGTHIWGGGYNVGFGYDSNYDDYSFSNSITVDSFDDILFEDYANRDFHLQLGSPAIDIGDPNDDYSNEPEPNGNRINAGIYGNTVEAQNNSRPAISDETATTNEDTEVEINPTITDNQGAISGAIVSQPSNGTITGISVGTKNASITYLPNSGWSGTDTFTYKVSDGELDSNIGTATITIEDDGSWVGTIGSSGEDSGNSVVETSDGRYVFAGMYNSTALYGRISDPNGLPVSDWGWSITGTDIATSVAPTSDGGHIITGQAVSTVFLNKIDIDGNIEWNATHNDAVLGSTSAIGNHIIQTSDDGGYLIAGDNGKPFLLKINNSGGWQWTKMYDSGNPTGFFYSAEETNDGAYIAVGELRSSDQASGDGYAVKTNASGDEIWSKLYGGSSQDYFKTGKQTDDGGYIFFGTKNGGSNSDMWLVKTDSAGQLEWERSYGGSQKEWGRSMDITSDGGYILVGYSESFGDNHIYLVKTDSSGNTQWTKTKGTNIHEGVNAFTANSIIQNSDGGYLMVGQTQGNAQDMFIWQLDSEGNRTSSTTLLRAPYKK